MFFYAAFLYYYIKNSKFQNTLFEKAFKEKDLFN